MNFDRQHRDTDGLLVGTAYAARGWDDPHGDTSRSGVVLRDSKHLIRRMSRRMRNLGNPCAEKGARPRLCRVTGRSVSGDACLRSYAELITARSTYRHAGVGSPGDLHFLSNKADMPSGKE